MINSVSEEAGGFDSLKTTRRRRQPDETPLDRLPPHSHEMEQGVLGCVMLSPNDCMALCIEKLKAGPKTFYDLRHETIYSELVAMYDARDAIDILTVQQRLKDKQLLEQIGGLTYLNALQDAVPSAANVTYYLEIVQEKFQLRRMLATCTAAACKVHDFEGELSELLDEVERDVLAIRIQNDTEAKTTKQIVGPALDLIEDHFRRQGTISGLPTGFPDLDRMLDGLHGGEMIVIAARPSIGKTSLALNICEHVAVGLKIPVGFFSLEMTSASLGVRLLCSNARVNLRQITNGFMAESDFPKLSGAAGRLSAAPMIVDDTPGLSVMQFRARARRMWQQHGIKLFVVDYMQLLHSTSPRAQENRQIEIAEISGGIKALAKELNVPIIALSQLNRELEKSKSRKPSLSHLRESGAIEQDADVVGLLYKPGETDAEQNDESDAIPVNLLIAKQRNGPTGDVHLTLLRGFTRFESAAKVSDEDVPQARSPHNDQ